MEIPKKIMKKLIKNTDIPLIKGRILYNKMINNTSSLSEYLENICEDLFENRFSF